LSKLLKDALGRGACDINGFDRFVAYFSSSVCLGGGGMAGCDVFVSYARNDSNVAEALAKAISFAGHSVWVDRHAIRDGESFDTQIEDAIANAKVVLVLWSAASVKSPWVRAEASYALKEHKLIPVILDGADPPLRFLQIQSIDFYDWDGSKESAQTKRLIDSISLALGGRKSDTSLATTKVGEESQDLPFLSRLLARVYLIFPDEVEESNFRLYYRERVYPAAQFSILLGLISYIQFGIIDSLGPGVEIATMRFRFLVACPILLAFYGASFTQSAKRYWTAFISLFGLSAFCLVYITTVQHDHSHGIFRASNGYGTMDFMLLLSFVPLVQLPTLHSVLLGFVAFAFHAYFTNFVAHINAYQIEIDSVFVLSTLSVCCCIVYWRERSHRKAFASRRNNAEFALG
jgi:hypothetical protein